MAQCRPTATPGSRAQSSLCRSATKGVTPRLGGPAPRRGPGPGSTDEARLSENQPAPGHNVERLVETGSFVNLSGPLANAEYRHVPCRRLPWWSGGGHVQASGGATRLRAAVQAVSGRVRRIRGAACELAPSRRENAMKKRALGIVALMMLCCCQGITTPSPRCPNKLSCAESRVCCPVGYPIQCGGHCYESQAAALRDLCAVGMETCQPEPQ
jgi:hypothetical protein